MRTVRETRRRNRWYGLTRLAAERVTNRLLSVENRQTKLAAGGIAVAVVTVLMVTSIGLGFAPQERVQSETTDYWLLPAEGESSAVIATGEPDFGEAHRTSERLSRRSGVGHATPVLGATLAVRQAGGGTERVRLVGVIPGDEPLSVAGLSTAPLSGGDPYYAGGKYDGRWTGQAVVSQRGADALGLSTGEALTPATGSASRDHGSFTVTAVQAARERRHEPDRPPVVLVHLAELQAVTGTTDVDRADQFLVDGADARRSALADARSRGRVVSSDASLAQRLQGNDLPMATGLAAMVVVGAVGTLFVVTTVGFEVVTAVAERAVLSALGVSASSRAILLVLETVVTAAIGGALGVVLWLVGALLANAVAALFGQPTVAVVQPVLVAYGIAVTLAIAVLATPSLLVLSRGDAVGGIPD